MAEIITQKDNLFFLKPQINHLYLIEANGAMDFAVYTGILHARRKHNFFSLSDAFINVYHCDTDKCVLDIDDILYKVDGLPKILVTPVKGKIGGPKYSYTSRLMGLESDLEYSRLKKLFTEYGEPGLYVRSEFSDFIQKIVDVKNSK